MDTKKIFGLNFEMLRKANMFTMDELSKKLNVSKGSISLWESGKSQPSSSTLAKICELFDTTPDMLFTPHLREIKDLEDVERLNNRSNLYNGNIKNLVPITTKKIPVIGKIACGDPIEAIEHVEYYAEVDSSLKIDAGLIAQGDSMINARIYDGDTVFIHYQPTVENGEIAAVKIDDEVTLKRFYYDQKTDMVTLVAENPKYSPYIYKKSDNKIIQIIGKALTFQGIIK